MPVTKLRRLVTGRTDIDQWIDETLSAIERSSNVRAAAPMVANLRPDGMFLSFAGVYLALAKSGGSGIPAMSGSMPGKADVTLQLFDGSTLSSDTRTEKAYNLSQTAVGNNKYLILAKILKWWFVIFEDCT